MDDEYITRREHDEFARRMAEERDRQNHRIEALEDIVQKINDLTLSVMRLTTSVEQMVREQKAQGKRLEQLEGAPAKSWNAVKAAVLSAIGTAIGAAIIAALANFI